MPLKDKSLDELRKIVSTLKREFDRRDRLLKNRRRIRFRQMEGDLRALPLSSKADPALLVYQTEEVNQEIHRRVKRLVSNRPRIQLIVYDESPTAKNKGQNIEDGLRALYRWLNRAPVPPEELSVEAQQADGVGILKLDFVPGVILERLRYFDPEKLEAPSPDDDEEQTRIRARYREIRDSYESDPEASAKAYRDLLDEEKRKLPPPLVLSAVDPAVCYWRTDSSHEPEIFVETGKRPLSALIDSINATGAYNVKLIDGRLILSPGGSEALSYPTIREDETTAYSDQDLVEVTEIRTRHEIAFIIEQPPAGAMRHVRRNSSRQDDAIVLVFDNPFGPETTGYFLLPGDVTNHPDPAYRYQPPVLGLLNIAQADNLLTTIRLSAAVENALRKRYVQVQEPPPQAPSDADEAKTKEIREGRELVQIPGEIRMEEAPNIDLDKADARLQQLAAENRIHEVLTGDATSADSGHKLAIQVAQADIQHVPYQNRRAQATASLLKACLSAVSYLGTAIFVKEAPETGANRRSVATGRVRKLDPADFDIDYDIVVTVGAETAVTKYARWAALSQRYQSGTLSFETLMESTDVENPEEEIARIFEGQALLATMQQLIPMLVSMAKEAAKRKVDELTNPAPGVGIPPETGLAGGGGANPTASGPVAMIGKLPGLGMPVTGPTSAEEGFPVPEGAGEQTGGSIA